ncbi:TauD-domain-containing protein [Ascodesmis nigricans]|uniref:TauD-domain-containing protein n=1 Tax=Ascodesmis nigricans TaxID=341454 RepID=A0A4S2MJX6_9PEZI|nr:TauD-domain-containing protein [Ascodesmis nigricans]
MAPSVVSIGGVAVPSADETAYKVVERGHLEYNADNELKGFGKFGQASYPHYLPTWKLTGPKENGGVYYPLSPYSHTERGLSADPSFPNLLPKGIAKLENLTPKLGTEVSGIQLSSLSDAGKDELALFVAQRGVVAFRDQDFADLPIEKALEFGGYFGRHHIHPSSGQPEGFPEVHLVHVSAGEGKEAGVFATRTSSVAWHSDVTYEHQPPGTTFLYSLDIPVDEHNLYSGGDTAFGDMVEAYNRLSEPFKQLLHGLKASHSAHEQATASRVRGGIVRREPITSIHPIVRTHPATGQKALFVNPQFTRAIVGFKHEESEALLNFLYNHIATSIDLQTRVKWKPRTVVVWDNRRTIHSALRDWSNGARRHIARITPQAEAPYETPYVAPAEKKN